MCILTTSYRFGEIALQHKTLRTATIRAHTDGKLMRNKETKGYTVTLRAATRKKKKLKVMMVMLRAATMVN